MKALFSSLTIISAVVSGAIGVTVFLRRPRSAINIVFLLICLMVSYWAYAEFHYHNASSQRDAHFWMDISVSYPFAAALLMHFALLFGHYQRALSSRITYVLLYLPAIAVAVLTVTQVIDLIPVEKPWGWGVEYAPGLLGDLPAIYVSLLAVAALFLIFLTYWRESETLRRRQALLILSGIGIAVVVGATTEALLPLFNIYLPEITTVTFAFALAPLLGWAIWKYELFPVTVSSAADDIISTMADGLLLTDGNGQIVTMNNAARQLLHVAGDQACYTNISGIVDGEENKQMLRDVIHDDSITGFQRIELYLLGCDGAKLPVSMSCAKMGAEGGRLRGCVFVIHDIRQAKEAEAALLESEQRYRALFDTAPDGIVVTDLNGEILMSNDMTARLLGYENSQNLVGHKNVEFVAPEDRTRMAADIPVALASGIRNLEFRSLKKDGTKIPMEVNVSPLLDSEGRPEALLVVMRDISERKAAEKELQESESRLRVIMKSVPTALLIIDPETHIIVDINDAAATMIRAPRDEIIGSVCHKFVCPAEIGKCPITDLHQTVDNSERVLLTADGHQVPIYKSVTTVMLGGKQHLLESCIDITERKRAADQLASQSAELLERNSELMLLYESAREASDFVDIQQVIEKSLENVLSMEAFRTSEGGGVFLVEGDRMKLVYNIGADEQLVRMHEGLTTADCLCGLAARTGQIITSENCDSDIRHTLHPDSVTPHGHVIVPLRSAEHAVGAMYLYTKPGIKLEDREMRTLSVIGSQLAGAIERAKLFEQARRLSLHDPLTGLANRNLMNVELDNNYAQYKRNRTPFSLIVFDLDNFKLFNDRCGHTAGDRVLKGVAEIFHAELRETDLCVRFGGEEFLVILPESPLQAARDVAERIRMVVGETPFDCSEKVGVKHITISAGVAQYDGSESQEALVTRADRAMYRAKAMGRNCVEADSMPQGGLPGKEAA